MSRDLKMTLALNLVGDRGEWQSFTEDSAVSPQTKKVLKINMWSVLNLTKFRMSYLTLMLSLAFCPLVRSQNTFSKATSLLCCYGAVVLWKSQGEWKRGRNKKKFNLLQRIMKTQWHVVLFLQGAHVAQSTCWQLCCCSWLMSQTGHW